MNNMAHNVFAVDFSVFLQFVTAIVIIMLGVAIYQTAGHINKTLSTIALILYVFEAILLAVGQISIIGLMKVSELYLAGGDAGLLSLGDVLLSSRHFAGEIAMLPFGIGNSTYYSHLFYIKYLRYSTSICNLHPLRAFRILYRYFYPYQVSKEDDRS